MTTLAGRKIRNWREGQSPVMTRAALAAELRVKASTVQGWEEEGKRPDSGMVVNRLAFLRVAEHADWFLPATCPHCGAANGEHAVLRCRFDDCPIAAAGRGAALAREAG